MTALSQRKSKLIFETGSVIRERCRLREVVIEAEQTFAYVRLKGTRTRFAIEWSAIYHAAAVGRGSGTQRTQGCEKGEVSYECD